MKYWDGQAWHDAMPVESAAFPAQSAPTVPDSTVAPPGETSYIPGTPLTGNPDASASGSSANRGLAAVLGIITLVALGFGGYGLWKVGSHRTAAHSTTSVPPSSPSVEDRPANQTVDLGEPVLIIGRMMTMSGTPSDVIGGVVVRALQPVPPRPYVPVRGELFAANVYVECTKGNLTVNPFYFAARTELGTNLRPTAGAGTDMLPATEVPPGQKISGWLTFDVPKGQHISEIVFNDPLGRQLGRWLVK